MRFVDFLKATVLLSAASATLLALVTVIGATRAADDVLVFVAAGWWVLAVLIGSWLGRRSEASPPIARLLATAKTSRYLPEQIAPTLLLINRLWPLLLVTASGAIVGVVIAQVAAVATGFGIVWALAWRRQDAAVAAIEERDGVRFYVDRTSPIRPMQLVRTPGFGGNFIGV